MLKYGLIEFSDKQSLANQELLDHIYAANQRITNVEEKNESDSLASIQVI